MAIQTGKSMYGNYYAKDTRTGIHGYGSTIEDARMDLQNKLYERNSKKK